MLRNRALLGRKPASSWGGGGGFGESTCTAHLDHHQRITLAILASWASRHQLEAEEFALAKPHVLYHNKHSLASLHLIIGQFEASSRWTNLI